MIFFFRQKKKRTENFFFFFFFDKMSSFRVLMWKGFAWGLGTGTTGYMIYQQYCEWRRFKNWRRNYFADIEKQMDLFNCKLLDELVDGGDLPAALCRVSNKDNCPNDSSSLIARFGGLADDVFRLQHRVERCFRLIPALTKHADPSYRWHLQIDVPMHYRREPKPDEPESERCDEEEEDKLRLSVHYELKVLAKNAPLPPSWRPNFVEMQSSRPESDDEAPQVIESGPVHNVVVEFQWRRVELWSESRLLSSFDATAEKRDDGDESRHFFGCVRTANAFTLEHSYECGDPIDKRLCVGPPPPPLLTTAYYVDLE
jgi:hypothetical protein